MNAEKIEMNAFDQYIQKLEYYPSQLDIDENIFRYFMQLERVPQFFSIYDKVYVVPALFTHSDLIQMLQAEPFKRRKIPEYILESPENYKLNILSVFKVYTILQGFINKKVELSQQVLVAYSRLESYFKDLLKAPEKQDLRANKRKPSDQEGVEPVIRTKSNSGLLIFLWIIFAISALLMIFVSGILRLIFQGIVFILAIILSKTMLTGSAEPDFEDSQVIQDVYLQNLDYFFENAMLKQKNSP